MQGLGVGGQIGSSATAWHGMEVKELARSPSFQRFSRFNRDATVWIAVTDVVLWAAAQHAAKEQKPISCWSCGCSSGEEVYYLGHLDLKPL